MRRALPLLLAAVSLATACGPTPPDYKNLATVGLSACGQSFTADQIVHAAYQQKDLATLPDPQSLPAGTLLAASPSTGTTTVTRTIPCADDDASAIAALKKLGYTDITAAGDGTYLLLFKAKDGYGISGTYGVFRCGFVGDMTQNLTGAYTDEGLHGTFGADVGPTVDVKTAQTFAALTLRSQGTQVAYVSWLPAYVDGRPVFLGMEDAFQNRNFPSEGPSYPSLGLCATWVVPDFYGGCDSVAVGISYVILTDDKGNFQESPLTPSPIDVFQGYCGRTQ